MSIKIFERVSEATEDFKKRVTEWMGRLHAGNVRNICVLSSNSTSILVWYDGMQRARLRGLDKGLAC